MPGDWVKGLIIKLPKRATFSLTTAEESHSCPSPAKVSVESCLEESRQLLTKTKNKRDSGREEDALTRSLH